MGKIINQNKFQKMKKNPIQPTSKKKKKISYNKELQTQLKPKPAQTSSIHVTWVNQQGIECKRIISPNRCFCTHSFEFHENPKAIGSAFCLAPGCRCKCYQYVPYYDLKCLCRHSYKQHDVISKMCKMCNKCLGFVTNWGCKCGFRYDLHETVFEMNKDSVLKSSRVNENDHVPNMMSAREGAHNDKQNKAFHNYSTVLSDAKKFQLNKYPYINEDLYLNVYSKSTSKKDQHKKKQIERINEKYGNNLTFEKQMAQNDNLQMSKIYKPEQAKMVSPLELLIRPHNYNPVNLERFLERQYRKFDEKMKNLT